MVWDVTGGGGAITQPSPHPNRRIPPHRTPATVPQVTPGHRDPPQLPAVCCHIFFAYGTCCFFAAAELLQHPGNCCNLPPCVHVPAAGQRGKCHLPPSRPFEGVSIAIALP